jgi:hypothetical protein
MFSQGRYDLNLALRHKYVIYITHEVPEPKYRFKARGREAQVMAMEHHYPQTRGEIIY